MDHRRANSLSANFVRCVLQAQGFNPDRRSMFVSGTPRDRVLGYCLAQLSLTPMLSDDYPCLRRICQRPALLLRTALKLELSSVRLMAFLVICQNLLSLDTSHIMCRAVYCAVAALFHRIPDGYDFAFATSPSRPWPYCIRMLLSSETEV